MRSARSVRHIAILLGVVLGLFGASPALAQVRPPPGHRPPPAAAHRAPAAQKVDVQVMVVLATNAHNRVDPRLKSLLPHLQHLNYTGYEVLDVRNNELAPGQETSFGIAGGRRMEVQLLGRDDTQARMRVRMYSGSRRLLDTTVSIHRNRSFIVAGPEHAGGVLILPMTARY